MLKLFKRPNKVERRKNRRQEKKNIDDQNDDEVEDKEGGGRRRRNDGPAPSDKMFASFGKERTSVMPKDSFYGAHNLPRRPQLYFFLPFSAD